MIGLFHLKKGLEMQTPALPGLEPSAGAVSQNLAKPKRGRPEGSKNKRSLDLGKYIEAHYGGLTPGQQAAAIGMVTAKELRDPEVRQTAKALGIEPIIVAMAAKARVLALFLGCDPALAWELMRKERAEVMPYVHQRQAPAADKPAAQQLAVIMMPADTGPGRPADALAIEGEFEQIQPLSEGPPEQVSRP